MDEVSPKQFTFNYAVLYHSENLEIILVFFVVPLPFPITMFTSAYVELILFIKLFSGHRWNWKWYHIFVSIRKLKNIVWTPVANAWGLELTCVDSHYTAMKDWNFFGSLLQSVHITNITFSISVLKYIQYCCIAQRCRQVSCQILTC